MPPGLYFVLKYFSFTLTTHLAHSDTRLQGHNLFGPFDDVITEFDSVHACSRYVTFLQSTITKSHHVAAYLTDPDVTRNGRGVGQGEAGVLLTELLVLDRVL
jgi:hypothetical protein